MMLTDNEALKYLADHAEDHEAGRSIHWEREYKEFSVDVNGLASGATMLGNLSYKFSAHHKFVHWILQEPFRRMGREFKSFGQDLKIGYLIAQRQGGRQFTLDMLTQVLPLSLIRENFDFLPSNEFNVVIGDGYGVMTSLLLLMPAARRAVAVNLTKSLLLDTVYVRQAVPDLKFALVRDITELNTAIADERIRLIIIQADHASLLRKISIGLAISIAAMQEMTPDIIEQYFSLLRNNQAQRTFFYCCNRTYKKLFDGTELIFNQYPWREDDQIVLNETCVWRNWTYSKRPPFWSYRGKGERESMHRLVEFRKTQT